MWKKFISVKTVDCDKSIEIEIVHMICQHLEILINMHIKVNSVFVNFIPFKRTNDWFICLPTSQL